MMKRGDIVGGYVLTSDARNGGGNSEWAFAEKDGVEFFIKRFLRPTYPVPGSPGSAKTKAAKQRRCEEFESYHYLVMQRLRSVNEDSGNLVITEEFFRDHAHYYKVTNKVDVSNVGLMRIASMSRETQISIMLSATQSLGALHRAGLVHGDVKPENLLIESSGKEFTIRVIDFDNCFLAHNPPSADEMVGDLAYYSPEAVQYMQGEIKAHELDEKSDIFALGLVFCQYLSGRLPGFPDSYSYLAEAIQKEADIIIPRPVRDPMLVGLIRSMLAKTASDRPGMGDVQKALGTARRPGMSGVSDLSSSLPPKRRLRGTLFGKFRGLSGLDETGAANFISSGLDKGRTVNDALEALRGKSAMKPPLGDEANKESM